MHSVHRCSIWKIIYFIFNMQHYLFPAIPFLEKKSLKINNDIVNYYYNNINKYLYHALKITYRHLFHNSQKIVLCNGK